MHFNICIQVSSSDISPSRHQYLLTVKDQLYLKMADENNEVIFNISCYL